MYLIEERKCSPGCPGQLGRSPLHNASTKNVNLAIVMYLVEKHGCDPSGFHCIFKEVFKLDLIPLPDHEEFDFVSFHWCESCIKVTH